MWHCIRYQLLYNILRYNLKQEILFHTISVGPEFGRCSAEGFWLRKSHEVTVKMLQGMKIYEGLDGTRKSTFMMASSLGSSLAVGRRPQSLTTWTSPPGCLRVFLAWHLAYPEQKLWEKATQELGCLLWPSFGSHMPSFPPHSMDRSGGENRREREY